MFYWWCVVRLSGNMTFLLRSCLPRFDLLRILNHQENMASLKNSMKLLKQARENDVFSLETGYLRVPKTLTSLKNPSNENKFYLHENKNKINFHIIGFALSLALNWHLLKKTFAWWRHFFTTMTRILFVFPFIFKICTRKQNPGFWSW